MFDLSPAFETVEELLLAFIEQLPLVVVAVLVFILFYIAAGLIKPLVHKGITRAKRPQNAAILFSRLAQWFTIFLGFMIALVIALPNFTPTKVVQFLGVGGVAIGFAFRDILQNFLAGILLLLTEPFRLGDQIVVNEFEGTVIDIETRATTIKTYDGRLVVIPNADLFTDSVIVNTAFGIRRTQYDIGIGYGDDIAMAKALILQAIKSVPEVVTDPSPETLLVDFAPSSVMIRARWWSRPTRKDVLDVQDSVLSAIKKILDENGIDLPYPTQQILFHDQTEESDGNRALQREGWPAGNKPVPAPRTISGSIQRVGKLYAVQPHRDAAQERLRGNGEPE